jgi:hypothetical protein
MPEKLTGLKMIEHYLREHGYAGLYSEDQECGCVLGDLAPCGCESIAECIAGYKINEPTDGTHTFGIGPKDEESKG